MAKYLLLSFLLVVFSTTSFAQAKKPSIEPMVQTTHSDKIEFYDTYLEKHLLITASKNELILWNTQTGLQLRTITSPYKIVGAALCNKGEEIAILMYEHTKDGSLRFYNSHNGKPLDTLSYFTNNVYNGIYWKSLDLMVKNNAGDKLLLKASDEVFVVDVIGRKKVANFKLPTYDSKIVFTNKENEYFLAFNKDNKQKVEIIDQNGILVKEGNSLSSSAVAVAASHNSFYVLTQKGQIIILDQELKETETLETKTNIGAYSSKKINLSNDQRHLVVPINDTSAVYDLQKHKWIGLKNMAYDGMIATTADASQIAVLNKSAGFYQSNGQEIFSPSYNSGLDALFINPSNTVLMASYNSIARTYTNGINISTGAQLNEDFAIKQWITDSTAICIKMDYGMSMFKVQIRNIYANKILYEFAKDGFKIVDAKLSPDGKTAAFLATDKSTLFIANSNLQNVKTIPLSGVSTRAILFSPNSNYISIVGEIAIKVYDIKASKWIIGEDQAKGYGYVYIAFTPDSKSLLYQFSELDKPKPDYKKLGYTIKSFDISTAIATEKLVLDFPIGKIVCHPTDYIYAIADLKGNVVVRKLEDNSIIFNEKSHSGFANDALFLNKRKWLITSGNDKQTVIVNYETGKQIAKAVSLFNDGKAAIGFFTPNNYYMIPASNVAGLHFTEDFNTYSFKQFDYRFNRPDKVLQALESPDTALISSYKKAYEKRIKKLGIDTSLFTSTYSVPDADITNRDQLLFEQKTNQLVLKIKANDKSIPLDRFNIWVNEVPIYGLKGINLKLAKRSTLDTTITISLSTGNNKIETSVINTNGIESYRLPVVVNYNPENKPVSKLYFVGIGINNFEQEGHNLQWSVKDIRDLANKLRQKYADNIEIDTLFNQQVTTENILALKSKLQQSKVNDRVIVAYSGHGLLSKNYDYFLSTFNVDFEKPEQNGLAYDSFEDLVDNIPARQKLMLIDACHSGEVDKEELQKLNQTETQLASTGVQANAEGATSDATGKGVKVKNTSKGSKLGMKNSFELMQDLFANIGKGTGATIISAAGGMQYALEKNSLKNGVFTYSILEYMNEAKTSGIKKLKDRVNQRVVELTSGMQQPTSRSENNVMDWNVW
ncbi:hypothetical protein GM921_15295 [Pedobacter sp. LMG 31464]|uniref:Peptidase C14 caspase domain-containing protein n=1 Tax=Pedobacter planticolens TaxID=2679964 RepID=A0A923E2J8_9SPHI|nr:caspase family protein [Pedobacter planticolens]MBB2146868.1 hypothetical protein [Pedobacter planticolens]